MIKRQCDKCGEEIKSKLVPVLELSRWVLNDEGLRDGGETDLEVELCRKCYNKLLKEYKI